MRIRIMNVFVNSILVSLSTLLGLLTINQFLLYASNHNNQNKDFPRKMLRYLEPIARWTYPDFKNSERNSNSLFIVGDSYAEGVGDLFLKNSYNYSFGHFLDEKWRKNTNIYLAANVGSDIPMQLYLLDNHLRGYSEKLTGMPIKSSSFNVILYFYEGNDLENTLSSKRRLPYQSFKSKLRLNFPIYYAGRTAINLAKKKILSIFSRQLSPTNKNNLPNNICIGYICRKMPPLQSASNLSEKQITNQINYLEDAVKNFSLKYPNAKMCFVYIPSPATIYSPREDFYYEYFSNQLVKTDSISNNTKSLLIRRLLMERMEFDLMTFVDPTKTFQNQALKGFIHGKLDPKHFNRKGYKLMADITSQECPLL